MGEDPKKFNRSYWKTIPNQDFKGSSTTIIDELQKDGREKQNQLRGRSIFRERDSSARNNRFVQ
nr:unnamed protein product [Callosobruchus analis]